MNELAKSNSVTKIGLPDKAVHHGHAVSEGVAFSNADNFHNAAIDGTGVTIAVIDTDFFITNPEIASNVISATLFDAGNFCGGSISCGVAIGASHGTGVAEIIVDMAPNVHLRLYAIATSVDFNTAVQDAMNNNVDIISTSLGFPTVGGDGVTGDFRDGSSVVAQKITQAKNSGILVTVSAGNQGQAHWQGNYAAIPVPVGLNLPFTYQSVMEFRPGEAGNQNACLPVVDAGSRYILSWDEWTTTFNDYDIFLFDSTMTTRIGSSVFDQTTGGSPIEVIPTGAPIGASCIVLARFTTAPATPFFHINTEGNLVPTQLVRAGSIDTPADAVGALAVGAIDVNTDVLEAYSSSGPTDDGRAKPEICGPDFTFTHQSLLNPVTQGTFPGTSASAPHVAGAAALFLDENPSLTAIQLQNMLISEARDNPSYSVVNLCGSTSGTLNLNTPPVNVIDTPGILESPVLTHSPVSVTDVPTVSDIGVIILSESDSPTVSDSTSGMGMPSATDTPTVSDRSFLTHLPIFSN